MKARNALAVLAASLVASLSLCGMAGAQTYTEEAMGMKGNLVLDVTIEEGAVTAIEVVSCVDTPVISDAAIASLPQRIIDGQNVEVDSVTGATMTSLAIKRGVSLAIEEAGLDLAEFKKGSDAVAEKAQGEEEESELVIVGAGMSGLSAAISAAKSGVGSIVVLEKEAYTGGSSRVCGGGIWAVNSSMNEEIGVNSTKEELIAFLSQRSEGLPLNEDLLSNMYDVAGEAAEYFYENGLPTDLGTWSLGHPDSKLPVLWSVHNAEQDWETGESGYIDSVQKMAEDLGVEIRLENKVTEILSEDGVVTGVAVETPDSVYHLKAKKVILATGGFTRNADMVKTYAPDYAKAFAFTGAGSTGDGIILTQELGSQVVGEGMMGLMGLNMNYGYYGSIGNLVWHPALVVNLEGEDFGLSQAFYSETLKLLLDQTDSCGIGIFDATTTLQERLEEAVAANCAKRFDTLEELADSFDIDAEALQATAEEKGLAEGPYYGITLRPLFIGSIPGLAVDEKCHVCNQDGEAIENLFACGELIFGNVFQVRYPASGTGMGTSAYTGTLAGIQAAAEMA